MREIKPINWRQIRQRIFGKDLEHRIFGCDFNSYKFHEMEGPTTTTSLVYYRCSVCSKMSRMSTLAVESRTFED